MYIYTHPYMTWLPSTYPMKSPSNIRNPSGEALEPAVQLCSAFLVESRLRLNGAAGPIGNP